MVLFRSVGSQSEVVPIFKAKSHCDPLNYRPVSLTSVCCKVMEKMVVAELMGYLETNNILSPEQYGFRRSRSTEDQLLLTYNELSMWFDEGLVVDLALLDYSKAFDVVHHLILLLMLQSLGVSGRLLEWIAAFLSNRVMRVCVDGATSDQVPVTSGVPQGSVLGPILFLVYINHVSSGLQCGYKAFADDYKLYVKYSLKQEKCVLNGASSLQRSLDRIDLVSRSWNLRLNPDKCVVMRFARGRRHNQVHPCEYYLQGAQLRCVNVHRDLGVMVDTTLRFHDHVRVSVQKAGGLANNMLRSTVCQCPDFMTTLFVTHIRPLIDYASCVWNTGYLEDSRLLESVQRRWTKKISGLEDRPYGERLRELQLFSIKGRLLRADLIKYWKILSDQLENMSDLFMLAPAARTRGHHLKLTLPRWSSDACRRFFSVRCVNIWNRLPSHIVQANSIGSFEQALVIDYMNMISGCSSVVTQCS